jgi:hypothetical protein
VSGPSRYDAVGTATTTGADGRQVRHLRRRFLPQGPAGATRPHTVAPGERVDLIAAREIGDPERSWLLADANTVMRPSELSVTGRVILIPLAGGMAVTDHAQ